MSSKGASIKTKIIDLVALIIVVLLVFSGSFAGAVNVAFSADKEEVTAGATGDDANITFTVWVNLTDADQYVPLNRVELNLSGPLPKTYSFDMNGGDILGTSYDELTIVRGGDEFNASNYGSGYGYGYSYDEGLQSFGYGYGYGSGNGASHDPMNVSYRITLNTSNMYDGNYTASTHIRAIGVNNNFGFIPTTGDIPFTILPRVFSTTISVISANTVTIPVEVSTPVGNLAYTIETGSNATIPVTLNVTVRVSPPTNVSTQVNSTASGGLGAGAIPNVYYEIEVNDSNWYDNITSLQVKLFYNLSDIPSNINPSTLRVSRYLTTTNRWVRLDCGTCPRTLEIAEDGKDVDLLAAGVNTTGNYVWANLTHYSTFAMAGTVTTTTTSTGSSGGGGGGGVSTSEPFENIEDAERHEKSLKAGEPVSYTFTAPELGIHEIVVTGEANEYDIAIRVELLKGTSQLVSASEPGIVYTNMNIWEGTERIKEALIRFKVENSWLENNDVESGDIRIVRWDGSKWVQLSTTENTKDTTYTYYETNTYGFSSFAIIGLKEDEAVPEEPIPDDVTSGADDVTSTADDSDTSGLSATEVLAGALGLYLPAGEGETISIIVVAGLIIIVVAFWVMKRRME